MQQKTQQTLDLGRDASGEARSAPSQGTEASAASASLERPAVAGPSIELVVERENLKKALARVTRNKGAAGIDGMTVGELPAYLLARDPSPNCSKAPTSHSRCGGWRYRRRPAAADQVVADALPGIRGTRHMDHCEISGDFGNPPHSQFEGSLLGGGRCAGSEHPLDHFEECEPLPDLGGLALDALAHGLGTRKYDLDIR
jgi:hypothetical protein